MAGDPLGLDARALDTRGEIPERNQHPVHFIEIFRQAQMAFDQVAIELNIDIKNKNIADELVRSIVFKPEYKQAGMALLAYFGTIVEKKYPTLDVRIRIEQEGDRVSLIIETPSGEIEKIERELGQYALVVSGDLSVDEYMPDARDAMALRHKLELSRLEVQQTRDLLYIERKGLGDRIASLEGEIGFMRRLLDKTQYESGQTAEALRNIAMSLTGDNREMMRVIADSFETSDQPSVDKLVEQLNPLLQSQPSLANTLKELFVKGSIQGAAGNYLYAALMTLQKMA
ncbi:hypothetical protein GCM10009107_47460 [Ideonella azotifigens]|uniref:Uncharacterized protein n=2 Tax=Ideonella azotifigens TaxID=513160 RepID=A0ABN1KDD8_9BURK